jgi:predicted hotdog family 3-hydroxylacyl-ACP dehydratase
MIAWPLAELLPHAGDMILIDQVLAFDEDSIHTQVTVRPGGLFNLDDGSLPAWVGVELMAQSVAAYAGCRARSEGRPVEIGFLLGTRKYECNVEHFAAGAVLQIHAQRSLEDESGMGVFECHLTGPGVQVVARLNVYRPPQAAQYLAEAPAQEHSHV